MNTTLKTPRLGGVAFVLVTLLCWSSVLLFLRHLAPFIDGWTANGWRYGLCAAVLLAWLLARQGRLAAEQRVWRRAVIPALFNSVGQTFFGFAVYFIEPGLAAFLLRVSVIFSIGGAFILFADERALARLRLFWVGLGMVLGGAIGTVLMGNQTLVGKSAVGVGLGAASGAFFGLYGVSVRHFMRGVPPAVSFSAIGSYTAAIMIGLMIGFGRDHGLDVFRLSPANAALLVLSAVLGIAVGHIFYYAAIARVGVAVAASIIQIAPFLTAAASVVLFGEHLGAWQWACGALMIAGGTLLLRAEAKRVLPVEPCPPAFPVELVDVGDPCAIPADGGGIDAGRTVPAAEAAR